MFFLTFDFLLKFDFFVNFDSFVKFDFFVKCDIFLKLYVDTIIIFRVDTFIKNSWYFDQLHVVVNLIFLSTIDINIKNHPILFQ